MTGACSLASDRELACRLCHVPSPSLSSGEARPGEATTRGNKTRPGELAVRGALGSERGLVVLTTENAIVWSNVVLMSHHTSSKGLRFMF